MIARVLLAVTLALTSIGVVAARPSPVVTPVPVGVTISGVDLHDGMLLNQGGRYLLVGTMYGCGFQWGRPSPWCGFGVSSAPSLNGPWSPPTRLFSPQDRSPFANMTWQQLCGDTGAGCFNPRLIERSGWGANDGVWILWFNAPGDYDRTQANAFYALGCNGPTGPCGNSAGPPYGSTTKPSLTSCTGNGDFSIIPDLPRSPMMLCTMPDQTLASERLTIWGTSGAGGGAHNLAGLTSTEGPGAYRAASGTWVMTFNEPNCGYCTGAPTSYATANAVDGTWSTPPNIQPAWGAKPIGRRGISATSCGGQGRTVVTLDGQPYQFIDLWVGAANETQAGIRLEPLVFNQNPSPPGTPWSPFQAWTCR